MQHQIGRTAVTTAVVLMLFMMVSCKTTRNVPRNEYLLTTVKITTTDKPDDISKGTLKRYVRQLPNSKILGLRLGLGVYNLARPQPRYKFGRWLQRIGEPPVIYDENLTAQSVDNVRLYLNSRGFYHCEVRDTVYSKGKQRMAVEYRVKFGEPTLIDSVRYDISDTAAARYVDAARGESLLSRGERLDNTLLDAERARLATLLRAEGFYNFSSAWAGFLADTLGSPRRANLTLRIPNQPPDATPPNLLHRYRIDSITIYPNYIASQFNSADSAAFTTTHYQGLRVVSLGKPAIRPRIIDEQLVVKPDSILRAPLVALSNNNFQRLSAVQYSAINFREKPINDSSDAPRQFYPIEGQVFLSHAKNQAYRIEALLTTSGSIGMEGNVSYIHRNLFRGAEKLEVTFTSKVEALRRRDVQSYRTILELGGQVSLTWPGLLLPVYSVRFMQRFQPQTKLALSYNYQRRPDYTRTVASAGYAYNWGSDFGLSQSFTPAQANVIHVLNINEEFAERIQRTYLGYSYQSQIVTTTGYTIGYTKLASLEKPHGVTVKCDAEISGNTLYGFSKWLGKPDENGQFKIAGLPFSQYVRADLNVAYTYMISDKQAIAMRIYGGIGVPYLNSFALPFEKRFFEGGANGVRAWNARDLGPGAYKEEQLTFPNQTGDIKLEANFEYRIGLFWKVEGAFFIDAGNIWTLREESERPGADFKPDEFIRQIAIGYGMGLRLNLGFFVLRLDAGLRLYDPAKPTDPQGPEKHWLPFERPLGWQDWALHFGVGYPF